MGYVLAIGIRQTREHLFTDVSSLGVPAELVVSTSQVTHRGAPADVTPGNLHSVVTRDLFDERFFVTAEQQRIVREPSMEPQRRHGLAEQSEAAGDAGGADAG